MVKGTLLGTSPIKLRLYEHPEALPGVELPLCIAPFHIALPSLARCFVRFW
jgi:hypothetical protein